jgi:hypothetical protein
MAENPKTSKSRTTGKEIQSTRDDNNDEEIISDESSEIEDESSEEDIRKYRKKKKRLVKMGIDTVRIVKLNADNYKNWTTEMELTLIKRKLWNIIKGLKKNEGKINERDYKPEELMKAYQLIFLSCDDERRNLINDVRDPKIAWERLDHCYSTASSQ